MSRSRDDTEEALSVEERRLRTAELGRAGVETRASLLSLALADQDWRVRREAVLVAKRLAPAPDILRELIFVVSWSDDVGHRNAAAEALTAYGDDLVRFLSRSGLSFNSDTLVLIAGACGKVATSEALSFLQDLVRHPSPNVRLAAVEAVAEQQSLGLEQKSAALRLALDDQDPLVRLAALQGLSQPGLSVDFETCALLARHSVLKEAALVALGNAGDARGIPLLLEAISIGPVASAKSYVTALQRLALTSSELRNQVAKTLGAPEHVRDLIRVTLSSPRDNQLRLAVITLLSCGESPDATSFLLSQALGEEETTQEAALEAERALRLLAGASGDAPAKRRSRQPPGVSVRAGVPAPSQTQGWSFRWRPEEHPKLTPAEFRLLRDHVNAEVGIFFEEASQYMLERRLSERLEALGIRTFNEYYNYLRRHPRGALELEEALERVTTRETYFFRQERQLTSFQHELLPEVARFFAQSRRLRVWSAGCASGEEAYTLAILLSESELFRDWGVRVVGSDLCKGAIAHARAGRYNDNSLRVTSSEQRARYFNEVSDGSPLRWQVRPHIKGLCAFMQLNLLNKEGLAALGQAEVIFCRNVLIYFDTRSRRKLIQALYNQLVPGGYLLLGHSESLLNLSTAFELVHLEGDLAYKKPLSKGLATQ